MPGTSKLLRLVRDPDPGYPQLEGPCHRPIRTRAEISSIGLRYRGTTTMGLPRASVVRFHLIAPQPHSTPRPLHDVYHSGPYSPLRTHISTHGHILHRLIVPSSEARCRTDAFLCSLDHVPTSPHSRLGDEEELKIEPTLFPPPSPSTCQEFSAPVKHRQDLIVVWAPRPRLVTNKCLLEVLTFDFMGGVQPHHQMRCMVIELPRPKYSNIGRL